MLGRHHTDCLPLLSLQIISTMSSEAKSNVYPDAEEEHGSHITQKKSTGNDKSNDAGTFGIAKDAEDSFGKFEVPDEFKTGTLTKLSGEEVKKNPFRCVVTNNGVGFEQLLPCVEVFGGTREFRIRTRAGVFQVRANRAYCTGFPFVVDGVVTDILAVSTIGILLMVLGLVLSKM